MQSETASTPERRSGKKDRRRSRHNRLVAVVVAAVVALLIFIFLGIIGLTRLNDVVSQVKRQGDELVALRIDQSRAACNQQNDTTQRQRDALANGVAIIRPSGGQPNPQLEAFITNYVRTVNASLRFRDCSTAGISAYFANPPASVACKPDGKGFCINDGG